MKLLLELRNAAMIERDTMVKFSMQTAADALDVAMRDFKASATDDTLRAVNGAWVHGHRMLDRASPPADHPGGQSLFAAAA